MLPRRGPLAVPKVRRVGFFTSIEPSPETPRPNRSLSGPAEVITSSSPLSDSPSGQFISPVQIPPSRHHSDNLASRAAPVPSPSPSPDLPRSVDSWRVTGLSSSGVIILWIRCLGRRRRVTERCLRIRGLCFLHVQKDLCYKPNSQQLQKLEDLAFFGVLAFLTHDFTVMLLSSIRIFTDVSTTSFLSDLCQLFIPWRRLRALFEIAVRTPHTFES
ncbi:hypothetical protein Bca52824_086741 [Brassica carinata]|uniref:Uncharacterized protein n=1 Tax=Brassica carinata TaxID=52824 RepID=A0A8X7PAC1_BRACI|nr:hypothetical protein Bca52824_086741 [Brassica carinata]